METLSAVGRGRPGNFDVGSSATRARNVTTDLNASPSTHALLFVVVFVVGCTAAPFAPAATCVTSSGATVRIGSAAGDAVHAHCSVYQAAEDAARDALVGRGWASEEDFARLSRSSTIWVHADVPYTNQLSCQGTGYSAGCSYWAGAERWMELTSGGEAWAHELLHYFDQDVLHASPEASGRHLHWDTAGGNGVAADASGSGYPGYQVGSWLDVTGQLGWAQYYRSRDMTAQ